MTESNAPSLSRECGVLCAYLTGVAPDAYVQHKYDEAHHVSGKFNALTPFERFLLGFAATAPWCALFADTYARFFARESALRKKLILLLAILESCPPERGFVESVSGGSTLFLFLRMAARGAMFSVRLLASIFVLGPFHIFLRGGSR